MEGGKQDGLRLGRKYVEPSKKLTITRWHLPRRKNSQEKKGDVRRLCISAVEVEESGGGINSAFWGEIIWVLVQRPELCGYRQQSGREGIVGWFIGSSRSCKQRASKKKSLRFMREGIPCHPAVKEWRKEA